MSRTTKDNQRRLDRITQRLCNRHIISYDYFPWKYMPRRGNNRKVAARWKWKWNKAERYKDEWHKHGKFRMF
jgi:hypothetical protein